MKKLKIKITPLSYLSSSGHSGGPLIDIDVLSDPDTGLPYLNGKRVKGLLRESTREVLEIMGREDDDIDRWMDRVFGKSDWQHGSSAIKTAPNFYLEDWKEIKTELLTYQSANKHAFTKENVLDFFTDIKMVTSVEEDGIAKDKSLRTYRLIKPHTPELNIAFEGEYKIDLDENDIKILKRAGLNLRFMGTSRNRGLGKVKVDCVDMGVVADSDRKGDYKLGNKVKISITNESPIILAKTSGDQNTVNTSDVITGSMMRGMLASKYLQQRPDIIKSADSDEHFYNIFLSGKVNFPMMKPNGMSKVGFHVEEYKAHESERFVNAHEKGKEDHQVSKTYGKRARVIGGKIKESEIKKELRFHNSRLERAAGTSTEDHPGIYHYESISAGQRFEGAMSGPEGLIKELFDKVGKEFRAKIGKSKSVEYGDVRIAVSPAEKLDKVLNEAQDTDIYLVRMDAPLILENEYFVPELSIVGILKALGLKEVEVNDVYCKTTFVEQYNLMWQSKTFKYPAYAEGSVIFVKSPKDISGIYSVGLLTELGFGQVIISKYGKNEEPLREAKPGDDNKDAATVEAPKHEILKKILYDFNKKELINQIKLEAYDISKDLAKNLSPSQLSRLRSILAAKKNISEFQKEMGSKKDKESGLLYRELGKKLDSLFLFDELRALEIPKKLSDLRQDKNIEWTDFNLGKQYWMSAFTYALKTKINKDGKKI